MAEATDSQPKWYAMPVEAVAQHHPTPSIVRGGVDAEGPAGGAYPDLLGEREDSQPEAEQGIIGGQRRCSSRGLGNHTKDAPPSCVSALEVSPLLGDRTD